MVSAALTCGLIMLASILILLLIGVPISISLGCGALWP